MTPTVLLIVPGYQDSDSKHWQSHWQKKYPHSFRVVQEDWENAERGAWVQRVEETVQKTQGPIVFAAHSLGCTTVVFWTAQYPESSKKIKGALLVAMPDPQILSSLLPHIRGFEKPPLHKLPFKSIFAASSNDPYLPLQKAQSLAQALGSEFVNIGPKGHIGSDANVGEWEEGQALLSKLL